jgi:hypothetical protein
MAKGQFLPGSHATHSVASTRAIRDEAARCLRRVIRNECVDCDCPPGRYTTEPNDPTGQLIRVTPCRREQPDTKWDVPPDHPTE